MTNGHSLDRQWISFICLVLFALAPVIDEARAQNVYTWTGGALAPWTTATNWSPTRSSPASDDILLFNSGGETGPTDVPTETIGQFLVSNGTTVVLRTEGGSPVLTLSGGSGPDLSVAAGCQLGFSFGSGPIHMRLLTGVTAEIFGIMGFSAFAHSLDAADAGAIVFENGSAFNSGGAGPPFTAAGTPNAVRFRSGSLVSTNHPVNAPFGLAPPNSKIVLDPGSLYVCGYSSNSPLDFSGRTFGDFQFKSTNGNVTVTATGSGDVSVGDLTVSTNFTSSPNTLELGMTGAFHIKGDLTVENNAILNFNAASPAVITLNGASAQTVTVNGALNVNGTETLSIDNANGIALGSNVTLTAGTLDFVNGTLSTGADTLTASAAADLTGAGAGTGWVAGNLKRNVPLSGARTFDVGSLSGYAPVSLQVNGLASAFDLIASSAAGDHPDLASSAINPARSVNRYWTLTPASSPTFADYSATFAFPSGDVDLGAIPGSFFVAKYDGGWMTLSPGARIATSTQATGVTSFGDFAIGEVPECLIVSIQDIGNDQGRQVRIRFSGSQHDVPGDPTPIVQYEAYRRIDPLPGVPGKPTGTQLLSRRTAQARAAGMLSDAGILAAGWDYATAVPAHGEAEYNMIAATLEDSTEANPLPAAYSTFFIRAATAVPTVYFDSCPDSGYSVDNLAPMAPMNLVAMVQPQVGADLSWLGVEDADFDYYAIYRDVTSGFEASESNRIGFTTDITFVDESITSPGTYYYLVTAFDFSGNEGLPSNEASVALITSDAVPRSTVYALGQNRPNPFNPVTEISFDLPRSGRVILEIYNVRGEIVARLVDRDFSAGLHTVQWDGTDRGGIRVGSGEYYYRIQAGDFTETKKMVLLK